ncbi:uncharacterized protein EV422DRAFT_396652 [Fimicolochytrium jonesii]|uniref:uncharacterized protein n=1 Tax=Fimicolochytrium jonesii TaxID=1396493 RepID=UPI0022FDFF2C|nr:uncharacterized protein EV422DRAFT_396652 [Fimicolochytrium jonesii]KAI8822391.1 hypothetical protein EV422DRAFT_396652 [Fimicolochytrium jonesii]
MDSHVSDLRSLVEKNLHSVLASTIPFLSTHLTSIGSALWKDPARYISSTHEHEEDDWNTSGMSATTSRMGSITEGVASAPLKIMVAANNSPAAFCALDYARRLCEKLGNVQYDLLVVYFVALNPQRNVPYLDHLERAYNMDIQDTAEKDVGLCKAYLKTHYNGRVNYRFLEVEGEGETGPLMEEFVNESHSDLDLFIIGTRNLGTLQRWAFGSVSDYVLHHLSCPVTVVKDPSTLEHDD